MVQHSIISPTRKPVASNDVRPHRFPVGEVPMVRRQPLVEEVRGQLRELINNGTYA